MGTEVRGHRDRSTEIPEEQRGTGKTEAVLWFRVQTPVPGHPGSGQGLTLPAGTARQSLTALCASVSSSLNGVLIPSASEGCGKA